MLDRARAVLGDARGARTWLDRPNWALSFEKPKRLLRTKAGTDSVLGILDRIDFGIYS
ncbi:MAG: DUF2384 domain-containing protein [Anaeromyxobacter sp.]|nr:DUF2384 domain-containing protein [Anaeromyxobacter sp.]MBL0276903.1 DUF2384 domain-containing protein [Anaeromyxobacter sp.]